MILLALFIQLNSHALPTPATKLPLSVECAFQFSRLPSCPQIISDFFNLYGSHFSEALPTNKAAVHLLITDRLRPSGNNEYDFHFKADPEFFDMEEIKVGIELEQNLDDSGRLTAVVDSLFRGIMPFLDLKADRTGEDITVVLEAPEISSETQTTTSKFYGELNGSFSTNTSEVNSNLSGNAGAYGSYMGDRFKVQLFANGSYQKVSVKQQNGDIQADNFFDFERGIGSYSFGKKRKWSVALITTHQTNPGSNIKQNKQLGAGLEWNLVPYRTTENHQFMFQLGAARSDLALYVPNKVNFTRDQFNYAFAQFSAYWLLAKNKLSVTAGSFYSKNMKYQGYNFLQMNASAGYQISKSLRLTYGVNYQYQRNSITFQHEIDDSNPLKSTFYQNAPGPAINQFIRFTFNFGNNAAKVRDLRWLFF